MATISGTDGNDIIYGTRNADIIDGGASRDYISGGGGNDTIIGGLGHDILKGGAGDDIFFFGHQHDADVIEDFSRKKGNNDIIALGGGIDGYVVTVAESGYIRLATIDWETPPDDEGWIDYVQGSIVLNGVTEAQWVKWGGKVSSLDDTWIFTSENYNPMIIFQDYSI